MEKEMDGMKRFAGLLREDLKHKLGMTAALWYSMGMLCLVFSMKTTVPTGEVRSLYVGPGNTSFFVVMVLFGIWMGTGAFRFLRSEPETDLYFGLPFTRPQLFVAGWVNNLLIFAVPLTVCRRLFFRISVAMGYSRYEESILSVRMGCLVPILGFLFMMGLAMLAYLLARNTGYRMGLLALFLLGPDAGVRLVEKLLGIMVPSFYRSGVLEIMKEYLSPLSLLSRSTGVQEYTDGSYWLLQEHLSYILVLAGAAVFLSILCLVIFCIRPAERTNRMFTFRAVEYLVRYVCLVLAALWLVNGVQVFAFGGFSMAMAGIAVLFGVPVLHGLLNMILAFDARKFVSAKWHLLVEFCVMLLVLGVFSAMGSRSGRMPAVEEIESAAVVLPALASGGDSEQALSRMKIEGDGLADTYAWIREICEEKSDAENSHDIVVKYHLKNGRTAYYKYRLPIYAIGSFSDIYRQEAYKKGTYDVLCLDSVKYCEVRWTNGMEQYTLDLNEQERQVLWEAYCTDLGGMTFTEIRTKTPIGQLTFASTKNQGDVSGYIYSGFSKTLAVLSDYGIHAGKKICDYEITEIVVDRYMMQDGLLYNVRYLAAQDTVTDPEKIAELAKTLFIEAFCVDDQLCLKDRNTEYTVSYRDSTGQTVRRVKCRKGI